MTRLAMLVTTSSTGRVRYSCRREEEVGLFGACWGKEAFTFGRAGSCALRRLGERWSQGRWAARVVGEIVQLRVPDVRRAS